MNISTVDYQGGVSAAEGDNQIFILDLLDLAADPSDSDYLAPDCDAVNQLLLFLGLLVLRPDHEEIEDDHKENDDEKEEFLTKIRKYGFKDYEAIPVMDRINPSTVHHYEIILKK